MRVFFCALCTHASVNPIISYCSDLGPNCIRNFTPWVHDSCVLRLTRVRAQPQASISVMRVCIEFHATAHAFFSGSSLHRLASVSQSLTVLAGAISSLSIEVVEDCLIGLRLLSPNDSFPVQRCPGHEKAQHDLSSGSVLAGLVTVESQVAPKVSGQKLTVRVSPHLQSSRGICCRSACARDSLLYSSFNFSRDYRSCRAQMVATRLQATSSTFEKLSVELRGHVIPEPRPIPLFVFRSRWRQICSTQACKGRDRGTGCKRTDEQSEASVVYPDRISECQGVVRTQLLRVSPPSDWEAEALIQHQQE